MVQLPYDVVYGIAEEVVAFTEGDRREAWPFDHPALLPSWLSGDVDAAKTLRACALVCKAWSAPASAVNIRHLDIWQATPKAISTALSDGDRYEFVHHFQAGRECCPVCEAISSGGKVKGGAGMKVCRNGVTMQTLLSTLSRCTNVRRVTVHEWAWDLPYALVDYTTYPPLDTVTSLCLGLNAEASRPLDVQSFRHLLQLLPALKRLSFGRLAQTRTLYIIPPPPEFRLESLAVRDARLSGFNDYEWLLFNSRATLRTLWVYNMIGDDDRMALFRAIRIIAAPLRTLYYFGSHAHMDLDILGACPRLEELFVDALRTLHMLQRISESIDRYAALRRLSLVTEGFMSRRPVRVSLFIAEEDVRTLMHLLSNAVNAFPKLEVLSILTSPNVVIEDPPLRALRALRRACESRSIVFIFPLMAELEAAVLNGFTIVP